MLASGEYTLSIYWAGQKNSSAADYQINVDAFDVFCRLVAAADPAPIPWTYQQTGPAPLIPGL